MPKIYDRNCNQCGKHYIGLGVKYCSKKCSANASLKQRDAPKTESIIEKHQERQQQKKDNAHVGQLLRHIEVLKRELEIVKDFQPIQTHTITHDKAFGQNESTAVVQLADWHIEEEVKSSTINNLNKYNLEIAQQRAHECFARIVSLTRMYQKDTTIKNLVIQLGGDMITGNIHADNIESSLLRPMEALIMAEELICSGIEFLLNHTRLDITIVCNMGNHPRITKQVHRANESGNSLEMYMYYHIAKHLSKHARIKFVIPDSALAYINIYNVKIRMLHGHQVRYGGGVGGVLIPLRKKINIWDQAIPSDITLVNHFHQQHNTKRIVMNGSMIGYNKFALDLGFEYEEPCQNYFLIHAKKGKTIYSPILFAV